MAIKIGINGMGRIGRMIVRSIFESQNKNLKIQHINNTSNSEATGKLIRHEEKKSKRHLPLRLLFKQAYQSIINLHPCVMMSPSTAAQYLPKKTDIFDVLIIDEASQMKPEQAFSLIARCKQMIIVGDQKQLPPSSRFEKDYTTDEMLDELPNRSIKRTTDYLGTGLDVFCSKKSYIIIDGEHEDGEGRYYSPGGLDVCDLQHPPKEVWDLILEIAELQSHDKSSSQTYSNTKSKKLYPCPICGRDKNHWCFENDNGLIHCMNGQTFSAEKKHGPLKIGDVIDGYALVAQISTCNTFKLHNPISKRIYNPRPLNRRSASARR